MSNVQIIKKLAQERGIRMGYIYEKIGCSRSKFSDVESGRSSISEQEYSIIASILHTTPQYLKGETDDPAPPKEYAPVQMDEGDGDVVIFFRSGDQPIRKKMTKEELEAFRKMASSLGEDVDPRI